MNKDLIIFIIVGTKSGIHVYVILFRPTIATYKTGVTDEYIFISLCSCVNFIHLFSVLEIIYILGDIVKILSSFVLFYLAAPAVKTIASCAVITASKLVIVIHGTLGHL